MKKIISILVAISLVLTSAIPAFAEETDSKDLEKAITQVKNVVTIPADYNNFQYNSSQYEENGKQASVWYLNWNKEDYSAGISASVENGGYLISYNIYSDQQKEGLGKVTRDAGMKTASAFLAKARPDLAADLKLMEDTNDANTDRHYYRYKLYKNEVMVYFTEVQVEIDKFTGQVIGFSCQGAGEDFSKLPPKEGVIGLEAAQKAYMEKIKVMLSYYSHFDYNKKILTIFPGYSGTNTEGNVIDAKTGEAVPLYNDYINYGDKGGMGGMAKSMDSAAAENALTKEELAAVESVAGLISKEKAESILRNTAPGITSSMKTLSASLSKNYIEPDKYLWEVGFDGAYGVVNAKTGEVTSFYIYSDDSSKGRAGISEAKAKEKAEAFMKKAASEKFAQSRYYQNPINRLYRGISDENLIEYSFNYYRQVNGIDFIGNGFTVIVNKASGMITHYDCSWYDGVTFPSVEDVISEEKAFDAVNTSGKLDLMYKKVKDGEIALVYDFTYSVGNFLIDPVNGSRLGWDGKPYKDASLPEYTDVKGHWAEATIKKLLENGYYLEGEKFNPNQKINQMSFLRYLYSPIQIYYDDEQFYKMMVNDKIIRDNEEAPAALLSRQDAAKFAVRFLGQGKAAEHPEIFINPFKDRVTDSYKGYAAICYGLKVMQGDKKGRFNGMSQVTNAEAAMIIYNTLQVR
ncbi:MAG: S-layer homology domain-containing protein [Eubacteriales bacterium]|nr:S-layer homology domain-containing protein [Eubacteriales bacterium]